MSDCQSIINNLFAKILSFCNMNQQIIQNRREICEKMIKNEI